MEIKISGAPETEGYILSNKALNNILTSNIYQGNNIINYLFDDEDKSYLERVSRIIDDYILEYTPFCITYADSNGSTVNFQTFQVLINNVYEHVTINPGWTEETGDETGIYDYNDDPAGGPRKYYSYLHPCINNQFFNYGLSNERQPFCGFILSNVEYLEYNKDNLKNDAWAIFIPGESAPLVNMNNNLSRVLFDFADSNVTAESLRKISYGHMDIHNDDINGNSLDGQHIYIYPCISQYDNGIWMDDYKAIKVDDTSDLTNINSEEDFTKIEIDNSYTLNIEFECDDNCSYRQVGDNNSSSWTGPDPTGLGQYIIPTTNSSFSFNIVCKGIEPSNIDDYEFVGIIAYVRDSYVNGEGTITWKSEVSEEIKISSEVLTENGYSNEDARYLQIRPVFIEKEDEPEPGLDKNINLHVINPTNLEMSLGIQVESSNLPNININSYGCGENIISISENSILTFEDIKIEDLKIAGVEVYEFTPAIYTYDGNSLSSINTEDPIINYNDIYIIITPRYINPGNNYIEINSNDINNYNNINATIDATTNRDISRTIDIKQNDKVRFENEEKIPITSKSSIEGGEENNTLPYIVNITLKEFASSDVELENISIKGEWDGWAEDEEGYLKIIEDSNKDFKKTHQDKISASGEVTFSNVLYNIANGYALKITTLDATYEVIFDYNTYMCGPLLGYVRERDSSNTNTILLQKSDGNEAYPDETDKSDEDIYGADTISTEDDMLVSIRGEGESEEGEPSMATINPDIAKTVMSNLEQYIEKSGNMSDSCTFQTANQFIYFRLRNPYDGSVLNYDEEAAYGIDKTQATQHEQINFLTLWEQRSLFDALNGKPTYVNEVNYYVYESSEISEDSNKDEDTSHVGWLKRKTRKAGRALVDNIDDWFQWYKREESINEIANGSITIPGGSPMLFVGPYLSNDYDCCINSDAVRSSMILGPGESVTVPIIVLYKTYDEDGRNEAAYSVGFDVRNSLYSDPLFYQFTINAKYSSSIADITSSQKANTSSSNKYNSTVR